MVASDVSTLMLIQLVLKCINMMTTRENWCL